MLVTRDDHVNNYFTDKFVPMCYVSYFINGNEQKSSDIFVTLFILSNTNFYIFIFHRRIYQEITHSKTKMTIYPKLY